MRLVALIFALFAVSACATPVAAETSAPDAIASCLASADREARRACIGVVEAPCMDEPAGVTTVGMIRCLTREQELWNAQVTELVARARAQESPTQVAQLNRMLQLYEPWLNARCSYSASINEGGSMARIVAAACVRNMTADLAIDMLERFD